MSDALEQYVSSVSGPEHPLLAALREETAAMPEAGMQISSAQAHFFQWLLPLIGARRCLEIGVFTGASSLACALALPADGYLLALDQSKAWTDIARRYWRKAGVDGKVELRLGPALATLEKLLDLPDAFESFDFVFIDADKSSYQHYYECSLQLVRRGGVIAIDNTLWGGRVLVADSTDIDTQSIRQLNASLSQDRRVQIAMLPLGDGLTLLRKL
ncbi:MAG: class I SAM-dependent methyltransferase [Leptospirales bacterium]|nr:class I SAM-dependent methyltransferase [Leptospirales bacterium]